MIPFFTVMTIAVAVTFIEIALTMLNEIYIGGALLGASIMSALYLYIVKMKLNKDI